jgi:pimeloyl-ACP methyl ester carboxylesterase
MLTHRVDGSGASLLLLNGGLMTLGGWDPFLAPLAERFRVIRCDFRGQLLTPGPYPRTWSEHALDLIDLLDRLDVDKAHVAGVSFGAEVAMVLAALAPARVASLTAITATDRTVGWMREDAREARAIAEQAAAGGDGSEMIRRVLAATFSDWWLEQHPGFIETRVRLVSMLQPSYFAGAAAILALLDELDLTTTLPNITAPTRVIGGAHDRVFPPEHSAAIAAAIPNATLEIVPGTGHGLLVEKAERLLEVLLATGG